MKKILITSILIHFSLLLNLTAQTEKEIKAEIKHVTVFPDRAQIDHETSVSLCRKKCSQTFRTFALYRCAEHSGKGYGEFTILSVNQQNNYLQNLEDSRR